MSSRGGVYLLSTLCLTALLRPERKLQLHALAGDHPFPWLLSPWLATFVFFLVVSSGQFPTVQRCWHPANAIMLRGFEITFDLFWVHLYLYWLCEQCFRKRGHLMDSDGMFQLSEWWLFIACSTPRKNRMTHQLLVVLCCSLMFIDVHY